MAFLQPFILVALAAAGIPLLLHLLTLRRFRVVPFSTLAFLKELQRSRIRAVRLRQIILLVLRTLLILLVVLAFARPTLSGRLPAGIGADAQTDAVILLDDSYSMTVRDERGERMQQAREAVTTIARSLRPDDRVILLPLSQVRRPLDAAPLGWGPPDAVVSDVRTVSPSAVRVPLDAGLRRAAALLSERTAAVREVHIVSDLQRSALEPSAPADPTFGPGHSAAFVRVGVGTPSNVSVASLEVPAAVVDIGKPLEFHITVRNDDDRGGASVSASMFFGSERTDQRVRDVPAGAQESIELRLTPSRPGLSDAAIIVEGDDVEFDNARHVALRVPADRRVLVIGTVSETSYLTIALQSAGPDKRTGFRVTALPPDRVTTAMLPDYDAFVVLRPPATAETADVLRSLVRSGKGLLVAPPVDDIVLPAMTAFAASVGVSMSTVERVGDGPRAVSFGRSDAAHPLFRDMFAEPSGGARPSPGGVLESPDIRSYVKLRTGAEVVPIIALSNGDAFLAERRFGTGRVLAFAVPFVPEWSSFPLTGLFVPLTHRAAALAVDQDVVRPSIRAGDEAVLQLPSVSTGLLQIRLPDRQEVPVQPVLLPGGTVVRFSGTVLPGVYSLWAGPSEIDRFAVHPDPVESDLRPLSDDEVRSLAERAGLDPRTVTVLDGGEGLSDRLTVARTGTELWPLLALLALVTAIAEMVVSRTSGRDASAEVTA